MALAIRLHQITHSWPLELVEQIESTWSKNHSRIILLKSQRMNWLKSNEPKCRDNFFHWDWRNILFSSQNIQILRMRSLSPFILFFQKSRRLYIMTIHTTIFFGKNTIWNIKYTYPLSHSVIQVINRLI